MLAACLASLPDAAGSRWAECELIVVDNASTDNSVEMVRARFPHARLIALPENIGFTGGNNAGIAASRGRFVFLLNPDTVAHPGSIEAMLDYIERHLETGIVGPRLLNPDGTLQSSRRRFPTLLTGLIESTPLQPLFAGSRALREFYMLDKSDNETQQVDWLSGAALLCRRETLDQVGAFDPGYFMFSEEIDLCRRVNNAGWNVVYLPDAQVTHYGGQSTSQDVPSRHINFNTGKARYYRLHEGPLFGAIIRRYLLLVACAQLLSEAAKWLLGHKRPLRAARVRLYTQVLRTGLRERRKKRRTETSVLMVTGEYPPDRGGVGDYTCLLHNALEAEGVRTRVLAGSRRLPESTPTSRSNEYTRAKVGAPELRPLRTARITVSSILRALRGTGARIVHIQYQTGAYAMRPLINALPLLLRSSGGYRTVVTFHDLRVPYLFPKAGPVRDWANRLLARTAAATVATNFEDAERLRAWGAKRVRLIPIGANISDNPPGGYNPTEWRQEHGIGEGAVLLAYFGFLNSTKGLDDLLQALAALRDRGDFRLVMVGGGIGASDPTNRATARALDDLAQELGVQSSLIWTGYLEPEEVSAALRAADMAVLPYADGATFRRGSLLAVLEHSLPVITTEPAPRPGKSQDPEPRIVHGENAYLVEPRSAPALARAILNVSSDPELRVKLSAGAQRLAGSFSWQEIARAHKRLYAELASEE